MEEITIKKVMEILTDWNPLGNRASDITDLNGYRTEAIDILFMISLNKGSNVSGIIQQVLNQAFDISLTKEECIRPAKKIFELAGKDLEG